MNKLMKTEGQLNLSFYCPGCKCHHGICSERCDSTPGSVWEWNGSMDKPSFHPSLKIKNGIGTVCHSFITNGYIRFLNDCTHELAGQTIEIPEVEL